MDENWMDIEGYESMYQVSNLGRVKSLNYNHTRKEKLLKPQNNSHGYLRIALCKDGKMKKVAVHRLVAKAFIPNPQNLPEVNHKDENKANNCVENLEWLSHKENINYGTRNLRAVEKLTNGICSKKVLQFTKLGEFVKEWPSTHEIERQTGFHQQNICHCCNGRCKSVYGYLWRYANAV